MGFSACFGSENPKSEAAHKKTNLPGTQNTDPPQTPCPAPPWITLTPCRRRRLGQRLGPTPPRVHAENLVRRAEPATINDCLRQLIERKRDLDFPWYPVRVVCHDILGQTALVDLAGLRDAIAKGGRRPGPGEPGGAGAAHRGPSAGRGCGGFDPEAFAKNRAIEDRRNEDRFHFIEWTKKAFANVDVIPAGNGIMHQINLEKCRPWSMPTGAWPTPTPAWAPTATPPCGCAGRDRHGRGRAGGRET